MSRINQLTANAAALQLQRAAAQAPGGANFGELLQKELDKGAGVQFSKHAAQRVQERGIDMNAGLLQDLNTAVEKARAKGARDVVVIGREGAFIVNVPNNVVITTMSGAEMKENIFTNIDSAVIL